MRFSTLLIPAGRFESPRGPSLLKATMWAICAKFPSVEVTWCSSKYSLQPSNSHRPPARTKRRSRSKSLILRVTSITRVFTPVFFTTRFDRDWAIEIQCVRLELLRPRNDLVELGMNTSRSDWAVDLLHALFFHWCGVFVTKCTAIRLVNIRWKHRLDYPLNLAISC
jgi:hypothetical protein